MKNIIDFHVPFSGFTTVDFINCFTSVFMFIENVELPAVGDYECAKAEGKPCNGCGNCGKGGKTPFSVQEAYFFLFDTICGRSSLRRRFDGTLTEMQKWIGETESDGCGTDATVDFLFGFAGYEYIKLTGATKFKDAVIASVDSGKPVIAKVKTGNGRFRVITGYDGDSLFCPDYNNAQQRPEKDPVYDDIEIIYIIGNKTPPRYTLTDCLERIVRVMEFNTKEDLWGAYKGMLGWYAFRNPGMENAPLEERKARMKRVADTMWHTFNCHNFAEVFRNCRDNKDFYINISDMKRLYGAEFTELCNTISGPCHGYTHDLAWSMIDIEKQIDWQKLIYPCGIAEMVELTIARIETNDINALDTIKQILAILQGK